MRFLLRLERYLLCENDATFGRSRCRERTLRYDLPVKTRRSAKIERNKTMKFSLMMGMKTDQKSISKGIMTWPKEDIQAHIGFMMALNKELKAAGELVSAEGLAWPDQAKLVRAGKDGTPITDGVFPESKEFLIGYWIIDVDSAERAYQVAARASAA